MYCLFLTTAWDWTDGVPNLYESKMQSMKNLEYCSARATLLFWYIDLHLAAGHFWVLFCFLFVFIFCARAFDVLATMNLFIVGFVWYWFLSFFIGSFFCSFHRPADGAEPVTCRAATVVACMDDCAFRFPAPNLPSLRAHLKFGIVSTPFFLNTWWLGLESLLMYITQVIVA